MRPGDNSARCDDRASELRRPHEGDVSMRSRCPRCRALPATAAAPAATVAAALAGAQAVKPDTEVRMEATGASPSRRTANDGNVLLEDVPPVPESIVAALNRYQNVRGATLHAWTADGNGLYIGTRFGEVVQLHRV